MQYLIAVLAGATFTTGLSARASDPVITAIAADFSVRITTAALLSSAFAFAFALVQPVTGVFAERFGKPRVITACLLLVGLGNIASCFASSFALLLASRVVCGIGAGGAVPVVLAFVSDRVSLDLRQVTMSRILAGTMTGGLLGAGISGVIGDLLGWRSVFVIIGGLVLISSTTVALALGTQKPQTLVPTPIVTLISKYRDILSHPNAPICFLGVLVEGILVHGTFPYISTFVRDTGVMSLTISGLVVSGFAVGALIYSSTVSFLLKVIGQTRLMVLGAILVSSMLIVTGLGLNWQLQLGALVGVGWGYYMTHAGIQMFASEIAPDARAMPMALHAFSLFVGQMLGPIFYGISLSWLGKLPTLAMAGGGFLMVGLICSSKLRHYPATL